ncbi:hypothetical protein ACNOYE_39165 [Nannocystaceae bacterium ST9]
MAGVCDFIFLVDGTGSMKPCMTALKENIGAFVDELVSNPQTPVRDWRGRVICYRDVKYDSDWWQPAPFVRDPESLKSQLAALDAHGGGDEPESLLDALHRACNMAEEARGAQDPSGEKWRYRGEAARVVVVFTDATYHAKMSIPEAVGGTTTDIAHLAMANKIILILYAPDHECYEALSAIDKSEWEPIEGPDFRQGLVDFTSDKENFRKAMLALARSMSKSASVVVL